MPKGPGDGQNCKAEANPVFLGGVDAATDRVVAAQPQLFDLTQSKCANCYRVVNTGGFVNALIAELQKNGSCAMYDGEELAVKNTNEFNEQYDVLTSDAYLRRGGGSYRSTCRPAWF